jgi:two-component sensor histidine kinase
MPLNFSFAKKYFPELKSEDIENFYKPLAIKVFIMIGFPILVACCAYYFFSSCYIKSFILFLTLFIVLIPFVLVRTKNNIIFSENLWLTPFYRVLGILLIILFLYTIVVEQNFSQLHWCYLFPIYVAFALEAEEGLLWGILFFIGTAFIVAASNFDFVTPQTALDHKTRFLLSFFMVSAILSVISFVRHQNLKELYERQQALKISEERYKNAFEQNKILLKEVHHRVKNNLQVMSSLLYLQSGKISDHQSKELIAEMRNRIRSMAMVYENLYQSKDFNEIDMESYVNSLSEYLLNENKKDNQTILVKIKADGIFLGIDLAIPCCMILQELISNSIKHAFINRKNGEIIISFNQKINGSFDLCLQDNGIGFPDDVEFRKPQSLGLKLVCNLVDQISGSFTVTRNEGTSFFINFSAPLS